MRELAPDLLVADRFRLIRELGRGGMGSVWLAHHTALEVDCAVKFIEGEPAAQPELRARFAREAKAAAKLQSPNVVQILDHGEWEGRPYIAMELLRGEDLSQRLEREGFLSYQQTVHVIEHVARALGRAHAAGIVHRDLKPENIYIVPDEDREIVKVLDFGIAKVQNAGLGDSRTQTGTVLGTPYYMSPEQADGTLPVDHRSDLWALGVIAFQCVTGQRPFDSEAIGDLLMRIMSRPIPMPSDVADVPPAFDQWWARAASRPVDERFQSARELSEALAQALDVPLPGGAPLSGIGFALGEVPAAVGSGAGRGGPARDRASGPGRPARAESTPALALAATNLAQDASGAAPSAPLAAPPKPRPRWLPLAVGGTVVVLLGTLGARAIFSSSGSNARGASSASAVVPSHAAASPTGPEPAAMSASSPGASATSPGPAPASASSGAAAGLGPGTVPGATGAAASTSGAASSHAGAKSASTAASSATPIAVTAAPTASPAPTKTAAPTDFGI